MTPEQRARYNKHNANALITGVLGVAAIATMGASVGAVMFAAFMFTSSLVSLAKASNIRNQRSASPAAASPAPASSGSSFWTGFALASLFRPRTAVKARRTGGARVHFPASSSPTGFRTPRGTAYAKRTRTYMPSGGAAHAGPAAAPRPMRPTAAARPSFATKRRV